MVPALQTSVTAMAQNAGRQAAAHMRTLAVATFMSTALGAGALAQDGASKIKGDKALGEYLSSTCVSCHQLSGQVKAGVPAIVGWPADQFVAVMETYKDKVRDNKVMQTIAAGLSKEDIASLAVYFGSLKPAKAD